MKQHVFALVDCNNFFVSCERIFRPDLEGKPVVVLSSNDGCAVARSNEAKALSIPMGAPAFKYRQLFKQEGVVQFSANFELYGDISKRITRILTELTPRTEIYSIDEAFLDLSELETTDYMHIGEVLRARILQEVGVPVSVGIAPTKTLAKLATEYAKQHPDTHGVVEVLPGDYLHHTMLKRSKIEDVWGVGWRLGPKLRSEGVASAYDLANLHPRRAKQLMGVHGDQMVRELQGTSCIPLHTIGTKPKSIARTRTFGEDTADFYVIESAIASFVATATYRLRSSGQACTRAGVFLMTNRHKPGYKSWRKEIVFPIPTADTGQLISALVGLATKLFESGQHIHRAGIWLADFVPSEFLQTDLLGEVQPEEYDRAILRMESVDALNTRYGRGTVRFAAEELAQNWQPVHKLRSPRYTTDWAELPTARVKSGTI